MTTFRLMGLYKHKEFAKIENTLSGNTLIDIEDLYNLYKKCINKRSDETHKQILDLIYSYMKEDSKSYSHESPEDKKYLNQIWFYSATRGIEEFIQLFLEEFQDFDPNITNRNGNTAFIIASQNNRLKIVDILIKNISVNKNKKNRDGYNALYIAYISGHKHLVTLLKENGLKINLFSYIKASFQTWYKIHKTT